MSWDLIQLSDLHVCHDKNQICGETLPAQSLRDVIADMMSYTCKHYVATGDLSNDGSNSSYQQISHLLEPIKDHLFLLPGNHDDRTVMKSALGDWSSAFRTHCDIKQWRIIFLDSVVSGQTHGHLNKDQLHLIHDLSLTWDGNVILMMHHHCHDDAIRQQTDHAGKGVNNMDELLKTIMPLKDKVKAIFSGHVHRESKITINGIDCYTTPATMHYLDNGTITMPGYRWLRFHKNTFDTGVVYVKSHLVIKH